MQCVPDALVPFHGFGGTGVPKMPFLLCGICEQLSASRIAALWSCLVWSGVVWCGLVWCLEFGVWDKDGMDG
jgi:hypothetical protein